VPPVKYELGFYIPEDDILHSHCRENLKSYIALTGWALWRRHNVSSVKYELGFYIQEDDILHSHRHENLRLYNVALCSIAMQIWGGMRLHKLHSYAVAFENRVLRNMFGPKRDGVTGG
jgi:hypothetical protein